MNKNLKIWFLGFPAIAASAGVAWAVADWTEARPVILREFKSLEEQVAANSKTSLVILYTQLKPIVESGQATPQQVQEFCAYARQLGIRHNRCR